MCVLCLLIGLDITETANVIKTATLEKAKEVDEKLHITEKVNLAADVVKQQANALATKVPHKRRKEGGGGFTMVLCFRVFLCVNSIDFSVRKIPFTEVFKSCYSSSCASACCV